MRDFGREQRTEEEIKSNEVDTNTLIGIDEWSMPIEGFPDPFIVC